MQSLIKIWASELYLLSLLAQTEALLLLQSLESRAVFSPLATQSRHTKFNTN